MVALGAGALACLTTSHDAVAAERWIDRPMTLRRLVFAGDVGLGIGHVRSVPSPFANASETGVGLNLEGAIGVADTVELGLRTGARFDDSGRFTNADVYGRTLWTETYGGRTDPFANPEFRVRWAFYAGSVAEVGLDGRIFLPFEAKTQIGLMFGLPLAFHVTDFLRIDTGAYIPIVFSDPTFNGVSIPGYFWFQTSEKLWLGPMSALHLVGAGNHDPQLLLGFGLGYQVASAVDLKTMMLFPVINDDVVRKWGAGFGVQFRIGE
jgi:hypothetical protein